MKIGLITGASRGLGKSMAINLAKKGYKIIFTYKNSKEMAIEVLDKIKSLGSEGFILQLDTSKVESFDKFVEEIKFILQTKWQTNQIDFLINNAGIGINAPFLNTKENQFDELVNVHIKGPYFLTQKLLPIIKDNGNIFNLSSGLARFCLPGFSAYGMMKGAVEVMTRYLAFELGNRGISVNTIAPGAIETDFGGGIVRDNEHANNLIASKTAMKRAGKPDDIGLAIANIIGENCHWINGQRIEISGGMCL